MENVRLKMQYMENCIFRQGYFPESAVSDMDETFAFVSIDLDLYKPIFAALQFFYPRLNKGGIIFLHDYNHKEFKGIKIAVENFENITGKLNKVPLPDGGGTLVIVKN
jgi:O-methyltransferase